MVINLKKKLIILILISLFTITQTKAYYTLRSYIIMPLYSHYHMKNSLINKNNIKIHVPNGTSTKQKDWYPFVLCFNDNEGFSKYSNKNLSLTILYNFGHFNVLSGSSSYYTPQSQYFSSFYGAYLVKNNQEPESSFGFNNRKININELSSIPQYDQTKLVLPSIGCPQSKIAFNYYIRKIKYNVNYINLKNWVKIDCDIITNSPIHKPNNSNSGYIQYGIPQVNYYNNKDYPIINLKGRLYAKYIDKYKITLIFYILAPNYKTLVECDKKILSKSLIE